MGPAPGCKMVQVDDFSPSVAHGRSQIISTRHSGDFSVGVQALGTGWRESGSFFQGGFSRGSNECLAEVHRLRCFWAAGEKTPARQSQVRLQLHSFAKQFKSLIDAVLLLTPPR